jgi:hypothetical protein
MKPYLVDSFRVGMKTIIAQFIYHIQEDQQACRDADTHPEDVDGGEKLVFPDIAEGELKVVLKHKEFIW